MITFKILNTILLLITSDLIAGELSKLDMTYIKAVGTNRDFTYEEHKDGELNLRFDYKILNKISLDTNIKSIFTSSQFRYVELQPKLNLKVTDSVNLFLLHRSGHALDHKYIQKYPNENGVGITFTLYEK